MHTALRITAFTAALAATFGTAYGIGTGLGPVVEDSAPAHRGTHGGTGEGEAGHGGHQGAPAGGLAISEDGYTLDLDTPRVTSGHRTELRFAVRDGGGRPVTAYRREHGKDLHLVLASRDLLTYRHLHPVRDADGTWRTPVDLPRAGDYRVLADFTPARHGAGNLTLGADLAASGSYAPRPLPAPAATAEADGYQVQLSGALRPGKESALRFEVSRGGEPVTDLQPHLGAYGHLVALRAGDLAYLHVHPNGEAGAGPGPAVSFTATAPSGGTYRLFLDFRHGGEVRTAAFPVRAGAAEPRSAPTGRPSRTDAPGAGHGH
jgi:hypothetical protein